MIWGQDIQPSGSWALGSGPTLHSQERTRAVPGHTAFLMPLTFLTISPASSWLPFLLYGPSQSYKRAIGEVSERGCWGALSCSLSAAPLAAPLCIASTQALLRPLMPFLPCRILCCSKSELWMRPLGLPRRPWTIPHPVRRWRAVKMRMRKAMGSRQRGAETLPGAGMGCPRAGPLSGQGEERFREGGSEAVPGWSASFSPHALFCQLWRALPDAPLSLCQPALRATQKTPESVRDLEETESPSLHCHLLPVALYGRQDLFPTAVMEIRTASAPWWFMMLRR